jgi:hypothetical protein
MPFLLELTRGDGSRVYLDLEKIYAVEQAPAELGTLILTLIEVTLYNENGQLAGLPPHEVIGVERTPLGHTLLLLAAIHVAESCGDVMQRIELASALTSEQKIGRSLSSHKN